MYQMEHVDNVRFADNIYMLGWVKGFCNILGNASL